MPVSGAVAIGRNEGERLKACIEALKQQFRTIVYVDSGSSDGSVAFAHARGCVVVELDMSVPFTAARARNAGVARLLEVAPDVEDIQLVDGDSIIEADWPEQGMRFLAQNPKVGVVCGRVHEINPQSTFYNAVFDHEWQLPIGEIDCCGGNMIVRADAFRKIGGFDETLICGEDHDFCARLRKVGWSIHCLDRPMAYHDAGMTRFGQWWKRSVRTGHGYAELNAIHPGIYGDRPRSVVVWSIVVPLTALTLGLWKPWAGIAVLGLFPLAYAKNLARLTAGGMPFATAWIYAGLLIIGKFSNMIGLATYFARRLLKRDRTIIEYK